MARYDLMLGVTSAEAFVLLNQEVFFVIIVLIRIIIKLTIRIAVRIIILLIIKIIIKMMIKVIIKIMMIIRRWSLVLRQRGGTSWCQISSQQLSR